MDLKALIHNPLLSLVGSFVPQARSVIDFVRAHEDILAAGAPVVAAAIKEGGSAFAAAKAKAPEFSAAVTALVKQFPTTVIGSGDPRVHVENVARMLGGLHRMSPDEEKAWMDAATPHNDPSQENSKFGG